MSTVITEQLQEGGLDMEAAEATLLALGIHADTGSLTFDSATSRCGFLGYASSDVFSAVGHFATV